MNNKEVTPREFKVGDIVWDCIRGGKGKVIRITKECTHSVDVIIDDNNSVSSYTSEGKYGKDDLLSSLYHQPYRIELLDIPEELPEVGTPVYVWDDDSSSCRIGFFARKDEYGYIVSLCFPEPGDLYAWDNFSLTLPDKFK